MKNKEPNVYVDHKGAESARLAHKAIRDPTPENINDCVDNAIKNALEMVEWIKHNNARNRK